MVLSWKWLETERADGALTRKLREVFVKRKLCRAAIGGIAIDAPRAWCNSEIPANLQHVNSPKENDMHENDMHDR
jgi:hypothetical protein